MKYRVWCDREPYSIHARLQDAEATVAMIVDIRRRARGPANGRNRRVVPCPAWIEAISEAPEAAIS